MIKTLCFRGSRFISNLRRLPEISKIYQWYMNAVKIRGLPFQITKHEIINFFSPFKVVAESVQIGMTKENFPTGFGALCFWTKCEMDEVVKKKQGLDIRNRFIELYKIPDESYEKFLSLERNSPPLQDSEEQDSKRGNNDFEVLVQNLPPETTVKDLCLFFSKFSLDKDQVELVFERQKFARQAIVQFNSVIEARQAVDLLDHKKFNSRNIYLDFLN